jgi:hypothetical protein
MKRRLITIGLLIAAVLTTTLWAWASWINYPNIQGSIWEAWSGDYGSGIKNADSTLYFFVKSGGKISLYGTPTITDANRIFEASSSGLIVDKPLYSNAATKVTEFSRPALVINSASQLSSWTGAQAATNGVSWFPLEAGKAYEVDLAALAHSQVGYMCSGVSLVMWDATTANDQRPAVITIIPPTGGTLASDVSGVTVVYIVPYPGSGATSYGADTSIPQSMQGDYTDGNGVFTAGAVASGASVAVLNKIGESVSVQTRNNSGVSAFIREATLKK